ncbi:unnamed protein product [Psylliodes chrysocephalus]|uniref:Uncharacterized protein n=1 Tax=Psylliodes chrysocephalus TaxID=3402493 RepID=A0A9P0D972_9CUCU|nr:unnamed protein product [Psylliodes chrysocephala]
MVKKRRKFDGVPREVQAYYKKFIKKTSLTSLNDIQKVSENCLPTILNTNLRDLIWTISLSMWVGFNCKTLIDNSEQQIVDYLPQINAAPGRSVTLETLQYAQKIAKECNQEHIILTYDLGIAKSAMEIQITDSPEFDNIFINLGVFHIEMAFFKAIGKYIDGCGLIDILAQAEILAEGSVTGFIGGKHFIRLYWPGLFPVMFLWNEEWYRPLVLYDKSAA